MLNPSTADDQQDDPTIRRVKSFTQAFGYQRLIVVNLFPYRATSPADLKLAPDPFDILHDYNRKAWRAAAALLGDEGKIVCAWGSHGTFRRAWEDFVIFRRHGLHHLGLTKSGQPKHPLYLPGDTPLIEWENPLS